MIIKFVSVKPNNVICFIFMEVKAQRTAKLKKTRELEKAQPDDLSDNDCPNIKAYMPLC